MFFLMQSIVLALGVMQLPMTTAYSPGAPSRPETTRQLSQCATDAQLSDVQTLINVVHHATSTTTVGETTWITEVTTLPVATEYSTSFVIMIEPSEIRGLCESIATVIIPTIATVKRHIKSTTIMTYTPTLTKTVYSTSWVTQNAIPSFLNGPPELPFFNSMDPPPFASPQPRGQTTKGRAAHHSPS